MKKKKVVFIPNDRRSLKLNQNCNLVPEPTLKSQILFICLRNFLPRVIFYTENDDVQHKKLRFLMQFLLNSFLAVVTLEFCNVFEMTTKNSMALL